MHSTGGMLYQCLPAYKLRRDERRCVVERHQEIDGKNQWKNINVMLQFRYCPNPDFFPFLIIKIIIICIWMGFQTIQYSIVTQFRFCFLLLHHVLLLLSICGKPCIVICWIPSTVFPMISFLMTSKEC